MNESLREIRRESGRKGGKATGPQKSWLLKRTPEERSAHMKKLAAIRKEKRNAENGQP